MRALVTGAAGFVGQHLIRQLLAEGAAVAGTVAGDLPPAVPLLTAVERGAVRWLPLELGSADSVRAAVRAAAPDAVFHLAAQSSVAASFADPLGTWDVNATGTLRLVEALRRDAPAGVRLLLVSSAEVYGRVPEAEQPIRESQPLQPISPYGASKAAAELVVRQAAAADGVHAVVARSFNHTGPGQDVRFALPSFAQQLVAMRGGAGEAVLRVGNLAVRRDLADVRDVVRAYLRLLEAGEAGGLYNVCSGVPHLLAELVEELARLSGTGARIEVDPARFRPADSPLLAGDPARLRALGWEPRISMEQTLRDLLASVGGA